MELGMVGPGFGTELMSLLQAFFRDHKEVIAAYLFGSAANDEAVVNDVDVLVLLRERNLMEILGILGILEMDLAVCLGLRTEQIDLIPFDLNLVSPWVLCDAVNTGLLIKCDDEVFLTDAMENLSQYFLANEEVLARSEALRREMFS